MPALSTNIWYDIYIKNFYPPERRHLHARLHHPLYFRHEGIQRHASKHLKFIIAKYRWLYQLGLQGPDMFFYNIPILRHRDYRNVGSYMHEHKVNAFFECCLRRIGTIRSRQQQEEAISYLAGFINHYIADSICHPYVYGRIGYPVDAPTSMHHGDARTSGKRARRDPALEI